MKEIKQKIDKIENEPKQTDHQTNNGIKKLKTRLAILESKQQGPFELPPCDNIPKLLQYLNLKENCTKEDIRATINLRIMEISPECPVSKDIFKRFDAEKGQELTIFLNKASEVLLKWKRNSNKNIE